MSFSSLDGLSQMDPTLNAAGQQAPSPPTTADIAAAAMRAAAAPTPNPSAAAAGAGASPPTALSASTAAGAGVPDSSQESIPCAQPRPSPPWPLSVFDHLAAGSAAMADAATRSQIPYNRAEDLPTPTLHGAGLAVIVDIKSVKSNATREERAHFLLRDLGVPAAALAAAYVAPITSWFMVEFRPNREADYRAALRRLADGVPWQAAGGRRVHGWAPEDSFTAVRVVGVPAGLDLRLLTQLIERHGRVVTGPSPGIDPILKCPDGTIHYRMQFTDGALPLPTFITIDLEGHRGPNFVLQVYTDSSTKRCWKCAGHHLGQQCRASPMPIALQGDLWARISIPSHTLPPPPPPEQAASRPSAAQAAPSRPMAALGEPQTGPPPPDGTAPAQPTPASFAMPSRPPSQRPSRNQQLPPSDNAAGRPLGKHARSNSRSSSRGGRKPPNGSDEDWQPARRPRRRRKSPQVGHAPGASPMSASSGDDDDPGRR